MRTLVLASTSPRRKTLLEQLQIPFVVEKSNFVETIDPSLSFSDLAISLARGKAEKVKGQYNDAIIIGADTFIVLDNEILGKPKTLGKAKKMLRKLSGKKHIVITGLCLIDTRSNTVITDVVQSTVWMKYMSDEEIEKYVATKEPLDKAGAYGIQELGAIFIRKVEGDYFNIVGLPLFSLAKHLHTLGVAIL